MSFIVPNTLAEGADYAAWMQTTETPANPRDPPLLLQPGPHATRMTVYATDELTGLATDAQIREALRDATCIQAAAWVALGIDPATGGALQSTKAVKRKKLLTGEIEYPEAGDQGSDGRTRCRVQRPVPEARDFLRNRGLAGGAAVAHS